MKDNIFLEPIGQFKFDDKVASVFDDMLNRSIPFYLNVVELVSKFIYKNTNDGDTVYDLGCSIGTTLLEIFRLNPNLELIGVDNSESMIDRAIKKSNAFEAKIDFVCKDILDLEIKSSKAIISNYTFQFIEPFKRDKLLKKINSSLKSGGIFIFSEKVISKNEILHEQIVEEYFAFKKLQGYSEIEIMRKKEALESFLVPLTEAENKILLQKSGFIDIEILFKYLNFVTFIAIKK